LTPLSLNSLLSDQADAAASARSLGRRHAMSTGQFTRFREFLLGDSYAFAQIVCGHTDLVPELHMPLSYVACGLSDKLRTVLDASGFDSYVTRRLRTELHKRHIDWRTKEGAALLDSQLDFVNIRWFRGSFKSSTVTHAGVTFMAVQDPNRTIKITHAIDDKAWEFCGQIGDTVRSGIFQDIFPDRMPDDPKGDITQKKITLGGRTISHPQTTIQAAGYTTKDTGGHYDVFITDDLVTEQNSSSAGLKTVHAWLKGMPGFYMNTRRIRRVHVGTKYDEDDDDKFLTSGKLATRCLTIRVPIEEYEGEVQNILERGRPTIPQLYTKEKIQLLQDSVLSDERELDGARSWRCNYLLDAAAGGGRLFSASLVDDENRWWMGPYAHPSERAFPDRFLVARLARNGEGRVLDTKGDVWSAESGLPRQVLRFDPWRQLDVVMAVDPAWKEGGDNWAVSVVGFDHENVGFQLETRSDTTGTEGWINAVAELDAIYKPRIIGADSNAYQEELVNEKFRNNKLLRRLKSKLVPVKAQNNQTKPSRIRAGVAEPLKSFKLLLDPSEYGTPARDEMKAYKGDPKAVDGILDSLAMARSLANRKSSADEQQRLKERIAARERAIRTTYDPATGVWAA
jgi:hypothetical protein